MIQWQGIEEFVAIVETHGFTAAAKRLGVSTSHVSRQISGLEDRLQAKLLYRTTRIPGDSLLNSYALLKLIKGDGGIKK